MNLEGDKRLNIQLRLDFSSAPTGEARQAGREDIESPSAVSEPERPANTSRIMEEACERANLKEALRQVRGNKGSAGVDRMTVDQLGDYLKQHWPAIREQLLNGTYEPKPVRRVEIPKPDGGVRKLGIPTVLDRFIQQAVMQVLQRRWDPTFSQHSYGFRPRRSAHHAVAQAQQYIAQGYGWVIDLDLEKFFDRVNHDTGAHGLPDGPFGEGRGRDHIRHSASWVCSTAPDALIVCGRTDSITSGSRPCATPSVNVLFNPHDYYIWQYLAGIRSSLVELDDAKGRR
jgi:hypothetical protein